MPRCHDPRRAMDAETVVTLVSDAGLAGVQADPHTTLRAFGPWVLGESALCGDCRQRGVRRLAKSDEEGVALCVDLLAVVLGECGAQDPAVVGEHLAVPVAQQFQQPRRPLDVREEERDGPAREFGHPRASLRPAAG